MYKVNVFSSDNFIREYTNLMSNYTSKDISPLNKIIAYTPGRILAEATSAFICMNYSNLNNPSIDVPMLSATTKDDAIKIASAITNTSNDIISKVGTDVTRIIEENLNSLDTENIVLHNYIIPQIIANVTVQLLTPILSYEEQLINSRR